MVKYYAGSIPPLLQGLHRSTRHMPLPLPRITPCFSIEILQYSEQFGENLQYPPGRLNQPESGDSVL